MAAAQSRSVGYVEPILVPLDNDIEDLIHAVDCNVPALSYDCCIPLLEVSPIC